MIPFAEFWKATRTLMTLSTSDIEEFVAKGFVRVDEAVAPELVAECCSILWQATGCDPALPATWTRSVVRIGELSLPCFRDAANSKPLVEAYDQLVGPGRWIPRGGLGTFPIRFPSSEDPGDTGWHVDASFAYDHPDFMEWRVNIVSRGRALLMLFLLSDVGREDAPTRIRIGSHRDIAKALAPAGDAGLSLRDLASRGFGGSDKREEALASGPAGTVYLCHPFLVHAAQPHRGHRPRFLAQPPLLAHEPLRLDRSEGEYSPVERAIVDALASD